MSIEITVIPNGRVKVKNTVDGGITSFTNENHAAQIQGDNVVIVNQARTLNPDFVIPPSQVTTPAGPWTAEALCDLLNASPYFFKSAGGGGGGGITSVDTLTPITGTGVNPDPVRIEDGTVDGDTVCWNHGTGFWVIDSHMVNQRLDKHKTGIYVTPFLEDNSDDLTTGTPKDCAIHQYTDINVGGLSVQHTSGVATGLGPSNVRGGVLGSSVVSEGVGSVFIAGDWFVSDGNRLWASSGKFEPTDNTIGSVNEYWTNDNSLDNIPAPSTGAIYHLESGTLASGDAQTVVAPVNADGRHRFRKTDTFDRTTLSGSSEAGTSFAALEFTDILVVGHLELCSRQTVDASTPTTVWVDPVDAFDDPWPDGTRLSVEFTGQAMGTVSNSSFYVKGICFYVKNGGTGNWDAVFAHTTGTYNAQETITNMISDPTFAFNVTSGGDPFSLIFDPSSGSYSAEPVRVSVFVKRVATSPS